MHCQHTQCRVVKGDLEGGGLMKALFDGVVHSAGLAQVWKESGLLKWKEVMNKLFCGSDVEVHMTLNSIVFLSFF